MDALHKRVHRTELHASRRAPGGGVIADAANQLFGGFAARKGTPNHLSDEIDKTEFAKLGNFHNQIITPALGERQIKNILAQNA